jgi:hypothetical protein
LIAYRSFDTMLEMVVLVLAVVGVWPLAPNRYWGAPLEHPRAGSAAGMHADFPRAIVAAAWNPRWRSHLLGRADEPGGAVEGGAILAAMWMITMKAKLTEALCGDAGPGSSAQYWGAWPLRPNPQPLRKILAFNLIGTFFCCSASTGDGYHGHCRRLLGERHRDHVWC